MAALTSDSPEILYVSTRAVSCDGGGGALGHPLVYLRIPENRNWVECGYCDRRFILVPPADSDKGATD